MKFLFRHFLNWQENWAGRNFITNSRVHCSLRKQKCRLKSTTTNGWQHSGQLAQRKSSVLFLIQSEKSPDSGFFTCDPTKVSRLIQATVETYNEKWEMRNIILRSTNAKYSYYYSYLFFHKINKGDLPLMYSYVFCVNSTI